MDLLEREWNKRGGRLIVLYGRRRIGKTRLLMEFIRDKRGIFYIAEDTSVRIQINGLKEKIAQFLDDTLLNELEMHTWSQLLEYLAKNMPKRRFYLIIDEFTYLIKNDKGILSVLQKFWDTIFANSSAYIIISGSMLGLMNDMVLSYASPLYGRRSRDLLLGPLTFQDARKFVSFSFEDSLKLYLIVGGIPEYLQKASEYRRLNKFLSQEFFSKTGYFFREPFFMISQEFRDLKTYFAILSALAIGRTRPTDLANYVGVEERRIYPYLESLMRMDYVERETPILGSQKRGIYMIKDSVIDFWFNFVYRNREQIERGLFSLNRHEVNAYYGKRFERFIRREVVYNLGRFDRVGRWWYKGEEIDIVALNEKRHEIIFMECKWGSLGKRDVKRIISELKRKAKLVKWNEGDRLERFGVFGRKISSKDELRGLGHIVYDIEDLRTIDYTGTGS